MDIFELKDKNHIEYLKIAVKMYAAQEGWLLNDRNNLLKLIDACLDIDHLRDLFDSFANCEIREGDTFDEFIRYADEFVSDNIDDANSWID